MRSHRRSLRIFSLLLLVMFVAGILPGCSLDLTKKSYDGLVINEVMSSNKGSLTTADGETPDWIELYNGSGHDIDLKGYGLTDKVVNPYRFKFPDITIKAGAYLLVYATGSEDLSHADGVLRAGFGISAEGSVLALVAPGNAVVEAISVPTLEADVSYGKNESGEIGYFASPTPGAANTTEWSKTASGGASTPAVNESSEIVINEVLEKNDYSKADADGDRKEWVELKNLGQTAVDLTGWGLSDDSEKPAKWLFPSVTIEPGKLLVVFLSGKDRSGTELHANFGLSSSDEALLLYNAEGKTVDQITLNWEVGTASIGRADDGKLKFFPEPTPGEENTTVSFDSVSDDLLYYLPDVYISESKSNSGVKQQTKDPDYIEIANKGSKDLNLSGWGLSDSADELYRYKFPDNTTLKAGGYLVVYTDGAKVEGALSAAFGIQPSGESIFLTQPDGIIKDRMETGVQYESLSRGRTGKNNLPVYYSEKTPGKANAQTTFSTYTKKPQFSQAGGYASSGTQITITSESGAAIYYTTDGSKPTTSSKQYSAPVAISKNTPLRAMAAISGKLQSEVATETYLLDGEHDIPVVCVNLAPDDFSSDSKGIYAKGPGYDQTPAEQYAHQKANYWQDWEREISFEFYESDGTKGTEFNAGIRIFGQYSRELDQKSFSVHLRSAYGQNLVTYPFFRDYDVTTFGSFLLRTSGQDWGNTKIKDAFFAQAVKGMMDLDYMEYRPVALYINGEYWGLYNMREKENEAYVKAHYPDHADGKIDIIKGNDDVQAGSMEDWTTLRNYIKARLPEKGQANRMNEKEAMEYIEARVDLKNFMEWIIVETYFANTDTGNIRQWRYEGGKWRYMLFDLDWGLQTNAYSNRLEKFFTYKGHGSNSGFQTHMQMGLYNNDTWRKQFIELYAQHINTTFGADRMCALIDAMAAEIRTEMSRHCERWGKPASLEKWEQNISDLKASAKGKVAAAKADLKKFFGLSDARMKELFPNG